MYIGFEHKGPYYTMLRTGIESFRFGDHLDRYQTVFGTAATMLDAASLHVASLNGTSLSPIHRIGTADFKGIVLPAFYTTFPFSDRLIFRSMEGTEIGYEMTARQYGGATRVHVFEKEDKNKRFAGWSIVRGDLFVEAFDIGEEAGDDQALDWGLNLLEGMTAAKLALNGLEDTALSIDPSPFVPTKRPRPVSRPRR
ncbi:hypothetical protein IPM65_04795 [Candidatus Roizmanbacteria bacterium]|nr:MAG: hypothetical protein IPM65_04795 [Candidatus Roizmanbacteria bacterium]